MSVGYRIEDKGNVRINGRKVTVYKVFEDSGDGFYFAGEYRVDGWDASDKVCIENFKWGGD